MYNVFLSNRLISARNVNETQNVYEDTNNPHPINIKHATSYLCSTFYSNRLKSVRYVNEIENVCANIRILWILNIHTNFTARVNRRCHQWWRNYLPFRSKPSSGTLKIDWSIGCSSLFLWLLYWITLLPITASDYPFWYHQIKIISTWLHMAL